MVWVKRAVCLCAMSVLSACGGEPAGSGNDAALGAGESALSTTATSRGCTFEVTVVNVTQLPVPPQNELKLHRRASASCPWPAASVSMPSSAGFAPPSLLVAANELGVAVGYTVKSSYGGGPYRTLGFAHVDPETMAIVRREQMLSTNVVNLSSVAIEMDGTTLTSYGDKSGIIQGESGSGSEFVVSFPDFFTSTTPGTVIAF
ncbi:hypothetical protein [Myxococcus landrumensis]|uniref:Lipoprotein n=1 Tax=Myxococcus landrumensis TaxID=2813577 RepID=A0ABX7N9U5_9BACT|nr:hypothetical protein [Myxococcus landrumus]QSQ14191.1 hypothetical protein JY572_38775 [Myxococcus landrumus]